MALAAAAGSKGRAVLAGSFVITRVLQAGKVASPRRAVHASAYDKNVEDQVNPAVVVPDDVIGGAGNNPDKYWAPHPKTGVFGPAAFTVNAKVAAPDAGGVNGGGSVLDQEVWYRPLEDVEKPPPVA